MLFFRNKRFNAFILGRVREFYGNYQDSFFLAGVTHGYRRMVRNYQSNTANACKVIQLSMFTGIECCVNTSYLESLIKFEMKRMFAVVAFAILSSQICAQEIAIIPEPVSLQK